MTEFATQFTEGRSHKKFNGQSVPRETLERLWELTALAPTANNSNPLRVVFAQTQDAMEALAASAHGYNLERVQSAGAAAILAYDLRFFDQFQTLAPHMQQPPAQASWPAERIERMALVNANLQAGFFILAARTLGLDCGPMGGFEADQIEAEFFDEPNWRFNFVVLLGKGDPDALYPRAPRLDFSTACRLR